MIYVPIRGILKDGKLTVSLNKPLKSCHIGLLDFNIPNINEKGVQFNTLDISCDQIDSTFYNPKRILKRLCFDRVDKDDYYSSWKANVIEYHAVDSDDRFLTLNIMRTLPTNDSSFNITFHEYKSQVADHEIIFTLVMKPLSHSERWACI